MNRFVILMGICLATGGAALAQDASTAAQIAAQKEAAERDRLLTGKIEELNQSLIRQQREINRLANENVELQRRLTESERRFRESIGNTVTQKQMEDLVRQLKDVDSKRVNDKELILDQIKKLTEVVAKQPTQVIVTPQPPPVETRTEKPRPQDDEPPALANPNGYFPYKIKSGDTLLTIIAAFNEKLKEQGKKTVTLSQVKEANPTLNPNRMIVGKEILIPVPPDK